MYPAAEICDHKLGDRLGVLVCYLQLVYPAAEICDQVGGHKLGDGLGVLMCSCRDVCDTPRGLQLKLRIISRVYTNQRAQGILYTANILHYDH